MRIVTKSERDQILRSVNISDEWLAPPYQVKTGVTHVFSDPGYVLGMESDLWENHYLILSETLNARNYDNIGNRIAHEPINDVKGDEHFTRLFMRNIAIISRRKVLCKKKNCHVIASKIGQVEQPHILLINCLRNGAKFFRVMPNTVTQIGHLDLPEIAWGITPRVCSGTLNRSTPIGLYFELVSESSRNSGVAAHATVPTTYENENERGSTKKHDER